MSTMVLAVCLPGATAEMVKPGVCKTFKYEEAQMTNAAIVFTGWSSRRSDCGGWASGWTSTGRPRTVSRWRSDATWTRTAVSRRMRRM